MPELISAKTLLSYIYARLRQTSVYGIADRVIKYARRTLFIGRIIRTISVIFALVETSAVVLLSAAAIAVLLPITVVALAALYTADTIIGGRTLASRELRCDLSRERIYVISQAGGFGEGLAAELSRSGAAVFVITASLKKKFVSAQKTDGVYYVRHAFFFRLKRRMLTRHKDKLIYLL